MVAGCAEHTEESVSGAAGPAEGARRAAAANQGAGGRQQPPDPAEEAG